MTKELTKQDALDIMRLHFAVQAAEADLKELYRQRTALTEQLLRKHRVSPETHQLNLAKGCFEETPKQALTGGKESAK